MISKSTIESVLACALSTGGDFAEIFAEDKTSQSITLIDGKVDSLSNGRSYGVGIRVYKGLKSVYGYTNDTSHKGLEAAAKKAATVIGDLKSDTAIDIQLVERINYNIHPIGLLPSDVRADKKIALLKKMYRAAIDESNELSQIVASYLEMDQNVLIANSEGLLTRDRRVRTRTIAQAIASNANESQVGFEGPGYHMGFEVYDKTVDVEAISREAARIAVEMLHADYAPAGSMPVAIDNGFGGVIFHEACGHSLEATSVAKGTSEFTGKLGQQVASPILTAIDDGTISGAWGSQNIDDEGRPTQKNVLIENGILKSYLIDQLNARRMQMAPTASGRRESYKFAPTSRMTNTYIAPGKDSVESIIRSIDNGLYAKKMGGGSVNPATGEFNFSVREGYMVENGQITRPVRGASLIGKGSNIIKKIDMISDNLAHGTGMCGSISGSVPVFVGQPMIRVSNMTVGGK